ncbi:MAG: ATP-grasp domain-containing protein [Jatrophihabitans sp.]
MPSVLLATCSDLPTGDEDAEVLTAALTRLGVTSRWVAWTDQDAQWDAALVVLRSTWDYTRDRTSFLDWVGNVARLANDASVVAWNTDKTYLRDLAAAGVPTVESAFAAPGEPVEFPDAAEFVLKPSVGAGSRGAGRFTADRIVAARAHVAELHTAGRTVLVQPYLDAVETSGETALIYFDGRFSHAIRKGPMLPDGVVHPVDGWELYVEEIIAARTPDTAQLAVGDAALAAVQARFGQEPLYARVDLLPGPHGPVVTELELTEPSLFLLYDHPEHGGAAADRFAAAIAKRA